MKTTIEKHGRSFLIRGDSRKEKEYIPEILPPSNKKQTKYARDKQISELHKSGFCPIKEIALTFGMPENEVEKIITKRNK